LPYHAAQISAPAEPETKVEIEPVVSGETVLVVDDEPTVRMFVSEALGSLGYLIIEAGDSQAGLQVLRSDTPIDLLVTDIGLPGGLDGRQMAQAGRACKPGLAVLFMTGYAEPLIADQQPLDSSTAVLTKPFGLEALTSNVKALLGTVACDLTGTIERR
jgi:CheY-like chemotaxis protein